MTPARSALPPIDHARRTLAATAHVRDGDGPDAALVTDLADVRWLTGFTGSNGWAVVRADEVVLGTDLRYRERAADECAGADVRIVAEQQPAELRARLLEALAGARAVALDPSRTTHAAWTDLAADVVLAPTPSFVRREREVKDDAEVARIAAAARAADAALAEVESMLLGTVDEPVTEADVRRELEHRMRLHGADDRSYDTIVASGPRHAARPHHEASHRVIVEGDTVIVDVGALVDGYHSDMTRSWVVGEPDAGQRELLELVAASQRAGLDALRDGVSARSVDAACRAVFDEAGCGDRFLHGTGHGVGLEIHETPFAARTSDDAIRAGNVVTVEPGLYRDGVGGVRIEDLALVTETGHRVLTHAPQRAR